jgi:hypothetical protein
MTDQGATGPSTGPAVRIENCLAHEAGIYRCDGSLTTIPAGGEMARVEEPHAREEILHTTDGPIRVVTFHRSRRVRSLQKPRPGVAYLVSRLTAFAARHRDDLVFPTDERRDSRGTVIGAGALGRFPGSPLSLTSVRKWRWFVRRTGTLKILVLPDWGIGVVFTVAVAFVGAALGVFPDHSRWLWAVIYGAVGLTALAAGGVMWRTRNVLMRRRGTAYVIEELDARWTHEEKESFLAEVRTSFAAKLDVPPVNEFVSGWDWSQEDGGHLWDERVDDLVRAFLTIRFNDDSATANAPFIWAHWPVALAFGARSVSGRRGMGLQVWQRPSFGRVGARRELDWDAGPHMFDATRSPQAVSEVSPEVVVTEISRPAMVRCESLVPQPAAAQAQSAEVLVLRMNREPWGPLGPLTDDDDDDEGREPVELTIRDTAGLGLPSSFMVTLREWRCLTPDGVLPWQAYPAVVKAVATWLKTVSAMQDVTRTLVGMVAPQEITLGLGIHAGGVPRDGWAEQAWPLIHRGGQGFIVPKLCLGWRSLNPSRQV